MSVPAAAVKFTEPEMTLVESGLRLVKEKTRRQLDQAKDQKDTEATTLYQAKMDRVQALIDKL